MRRLLSFIRRNALALASLKVCSDADKSFRPHQLKKAESNRNETNDAETQTYFKVEVEVGSVPVGNRFFLVRLASVPRLLPNRLESKAK